MLLSTYWLTALAYGLSAMNLFLVAIYPAEVRDLSSTATFLAFGVVVSFCLGQAIPANAAKEERLSEEIFRSAGELLLFQSAGCAIAFGMVGPNDETTSPYFLDVLGDILGPTLLLAGILFTLSRLVKGFRLHLAGS